ncbi:hypothetical protein H8D36_01940 [archaeon]|nr:hypothetical protein [archaeon]MBL7057548.1 hypothetical protein [Candidatus Woesearchaeota archaeon]
MKLEEEVSRHNLSASEIANMSERQLDEIIEGKEFSTTQEQLEQAKSRITNAQNKTKGEYLQGENGLLKRMKEILYDWNILSPNKELERKNKSLVNIKTNLDSDIIKVSGVIRNGYNEAVTYEKKKLAIDVKISRKQQALDEEKTEYEKSSRSLKSEELETLDQQEMEWEMQESYLNAFTLQTEIRKLKADYVLTHKRITRLKNVLASQELDVERLVQTRYDLENQIEEIEILRKRGVSPNKVLSYMETVYSKIEECESIKNTILRNSYDVSEAISDVRVVASKTAEENQKFYKKNGLLVRKITDGFEIEYDQIKEHGRR